MSASSPIDRLRRLRNALARIRNDDADWFVIAVDAYLAGDERSIGAALGLPDHPPHRDRVRARDERLRALAAERFGNLSVNAAAVEIARMDRRGRLPEGIEAPSHRHLRRILVGHSSGGDGQRPAVPTTHSNEASHGNPDPRD